MAGDNRKTKRAFYHTLLAKSDQVTGLLLLPFLLYLSLFLVPSADANMWVVIDECAEPAPIPGFWDYCCTRPEPAYWCAPSPSPSPTPTVRQPVLLVPGLAASHNSRLILKDKPGGSWDFTPTIEKTWEPLINRLQAEGYEMGHDLFIVHYDWRQSNTISAVQYLIPAIDHALATTGTDKVDIIAHSMGGLVARAYAQSNALYEEHGKIDELIMLGTPNEGAAIAYVPWEGGKFPQNWSRLSRWWIERIERSLKNIRDLHDLQRPITFRTFFPSLQQLLPIDPFINRQGYMLAADQNEFLTDLRETKDRLDDRGIRVTTIASRNLATVNHVPISYNRTKEDLELQRWRDGHPAPDPIQTDTNDGDATVMQQSAQAFGDVLVTVENIEHLALPAGAQDEVLSELLPETTSPYLAYNIPQRVMGVDILSPVMPTIFGPNGEELSADNNNTFASAYFNWDDSDPEGPKMLTIADPPPGDYRIELKGTGEGDYTVITSYADEDEDVFSTRKGRTQTGDIDELVVTVGEDTTSLIDDSDIPGLLRELRRLNDEAFSVGRINKKDHKKIDHSLKQAEKFLEKHANKKDKKKGKSDKAMLKVFHKLLDRLEKEVNKSDDDRMTEDFEAVIQTIRDNSNF